MLPSSFFTSCCHNQSSCSVSLLFQPPFMSWVDIDSKCGGTEKIPKTWSESSASQYKAEDEDGPNVRHQHYMYKSKMDFVWKPSFETVLLCISTFSALDINMNLWSEHQHGHRKNLVTAPQHKRGALFGDIVVDVGNSKRVKEGGTNSSDEVSEGGTDTVPVFLSRLWSIIILMIIMQWCWWFSPNE